MKLVSTFDQHQALFKRIGAILVFGLLLFLTFNKHSRTEPFTYQSQIWADKAGYYVYLPALFHYDFNADSFPKDIAEKTGDGFNLNHTSGIVHTKYTSGVALLQSPFFTLAHLVEPSSNLPAGFSKTHHTFIDISAIVFLFSGLVFAFKYLRFHFAFWPAFLSVSILFLGTNLFYYSIDETGMSHVYSFFLFSLLLYSCKRTNWLEFASPLQVMLIGLTIGICLLVRPTNLLFLLIIFFLEVSSIQEIKRRFKCLTSFKSLLLLFFPAILVWVPQLIYWHELSGSFLHYSYSNETFDFSNPQLLKFLFSPHGGWLIYSPIILIFGLILFWFTSRNKLPGLLLILSLALVLFIFSSWWDWHYGCSFGSRPMVEFGILFLLPLGAYISSLSRMQLWTKWTAFIVIGLLCIVNIKLAYNFDHCFFGEHAWDWMEYLSLLRKSG